MWEDWQDIEHLEFGIRLHSVAAENVHLWDINVLLLSIMVLVAALIAKGCLSTRRVGVIISL